MFMIILSCTVILFFSQIDAFTHLFSEDEKFALLVACLSHDLDHRGTNNSFQIKYVATFKWC